MLRSIKSYSHQKVLTCLSKLYGFLRHCHDIHAYESNEDVYMIEELKTNIPYSKANNPPYHVGVKC